MAIINYDGISGISSITATGGTVQFYNAAGNNSGASITDSSGGYLSLPPGTIITVAASTPPAGHLKANGAAISRSAYATLFAYIGTTFGSGNGSTTFNIPDLRGEFIRGWDDGRGIDSGRGFGAFQDIDWKGFSMTNTGQNTTSYSHGPVNMGKSTSSFIGNMFTGSWAAPAAAIGTQWDSSEIRPRNICFLYCIKY
jgi:phage-related tail fiber protein